MGCDIHGPWIEYQAYGPESKPGERWYTASEIDGNRDYMAFGLMAGVRGSAAAVVPTHRGRPPRVDYLVKSHDKKWGDDCHSHSWLTLDEMLVVQRAYHQIAAVDGCEDAWSFIDIAVATMQETEKRSGKPTRAVFCFDN